MSRLFASRDLQTPLFVLHSSPLSFFTCPQINLGSVESQEVAHVRMRQRMFVSERLAHFMIPAVVGSPFAVDELPIASELASGHPVEQRFRRDFLGFGFGKKQGNRIKRAAIEQLIQLLFQVGSFVEHSIARRFSKDVPIIGCESAGSSDSKTRMKSRFFQIDSEKGVPLGNKNSPFCYIRAGSNRYEFGLSDEARVSNRFHTSNR